MSGGGSLPTPRGPPIEGLSETQGRPKDAMNTASSPLRVEPTQEEDDTLSNIVLQKLGCFPTCFQFTLLRLSAMMLLLAAWSTMIFFPCVHLEYTQVASANISDRHQMEMTIEQTCPADPLWWVEETIFINDVISQSSYYKTLNETNEKLEKQLYETDRAESIRYPLNGQKFVISGCLLLSFPLLISIMVFRCTFQGDDFMEEAMLDIVQIALFIVFAVVETKKEVFDVCTKAKMVPYGIITAGIIFIILALIFSIDFIILLKHSERLEAQKFLLMAVSLRKEMGLEGMNISIQQELESYKAAMEKFAPSIFNSITLSVNILRYL
ncbi:unnamed protein product [Toxocara canis]|uniref:Uncharacterized protein n=1 Tax=Toxocara canis TaxID=6265 RepID=A0A183UL63_TOXCA|nr:unnamed protein product [Toxocara canis]